MMNSQRIQYKKRKTVTEVQPDAPEAEWEVLVAKGRSEIGKTAEEKGGDPFILWRFKLEKTEEEEHQGFLGAELSNRSTFYDATDKERSKVANMQLRWIKRLIEAAGLDFDEVYPKEIATSDDLRPLVNAIEGKRFSIWTKHRASTYNGETMTNVDIYFSPPGGTKAAASEDEEEEEEDDARPARGGKAAAKGKKK